MKDRVIKTFSDNINLLDTILNDISGTTLEDVQQWLDNLYDELQSIPSSYRTCNCWYCGHDLVWGCDYDYSDIYGEGDGIVSQLHCPSCGADVEYSLRNDEEEIRMEDFTSEVDNGKN